MSYYAILFAPLLAVASAVSAVDSQAEFPIGSAVMPSEPVPAEQGMATEGYGRQAPAASAREFSEGSPFRLVVEAVRAREAQQVRIEQRVTIRVSPRPQPARPNMLMDLPGRDIGSRFVERKIGKCLSVSGIAGVRPDGGNRLLLFMRDERIVGAELERACRSRDFYSGFYLSRSTDGQLCVDRDTLLSRSGANCKLTRIRQLVETDD